MAQRRRLQNSVLTSTNLTFKLVFYTRLTLVNISGCPYSGAHDPLEVQFTRHCTVAAGLSLVGYHGTDGAQADVAYLSVLLRNSLNATNCN